MKRIYILILTAALLLAACANDAPQQTPSPTPTQAEETNPVSEMLAEFGTRKSMILGQMAKLVEDYAAENGSAELAATALDPLVAVDNMFSEVIVSAIQMQKTGETEWTAQSDDLNGLTVYTDGKYTMDCTAESIYEQDMMLFEQCVIDTKEAIADIHVYAIDENGEKILLLWCEYRVYEQGYAVQYYYLDTDNQYRILRSIFDDTGMTFAVINAQQMPQSILTGAIDTDFFKDAALKGEYSDGKAVLTKDDGEKLTIGDAQ